MKENIIVQIIRIFGALITTLLGIFIPKSFDNKKRAVVDKNCAIKEDEPCILLSSFSSILEQNINKIDDEYSKIFIKFSITLIAINQKKQKSGLYNFTAKLCYSRDNPYIKDGLLSTRDNIFINELLNIDPLTTKQVEFEIEWDTKIENKFLPDEYYVYLYYNVINEHNQKRIKISSDNNILLI